MCDPSWHFSVVVWTTAIQKKSPVCTWHLGRRERGQLFPLLVFEFPHVVHCEWGKTCQSLLISPGSIIDLGLLQSVPLLPPHSSSVLLGHITRHCGTAWMLLHTVSSLSVCWSELLSHCSCTATHTCSQGGGGGSRGTHCSAGLEQLWADEIWFSPICSFRRINPYRMHKQENWSEILLHAASFSVLLPGENEWGLLSYNSWKEIIVCVCVCV